MLFFSVKQVLSCKFRFVLFKRFLPQTLALQIHDRLVGVPI